MNIGEYFLATAVDTGAVHVILVPFQGESGIDMSGSNGGIVGSNAIRLSADYGAVDGRVSILAVLCFDPQWLRWWARR